MESVRDPVCGMVIDIKAAAGSSTYEEQVYYFCSTECKTEFDRNPKKYHERFTKTGPIVAPMFGSATSGGGEYEPLPDESVQP